MESLKVHTIRRHSYGGQVRQQGDEYFVDHPKHLKFLVAIKKVRAVDVEAVAARKKRLSDAAKKAAATRRRNAEKKQAKPGNTYERKDVIAAPVNKEPVKNEVNTKKD